ncbi:unnamed protein product [Moneuplotes crassus]|uniref:Uncharacterized protein n=1 Tax=Euplotes crassus TaxID=5936 RepID=A0AAD1X5V0_EUPCR|nr:unnamed protein product [Moneuplotes crassus]
MELPVICNNPNNLYTTNRLKKSQANYEIDESLTTFEIQEQLNQSNAKYILNDRRVEFSFDQTQPMTNVSSLLNTNSQEKDKENECNNIQHSRNYSNTALSITGRKRGLHAKPPSANKKSKHKFKPIASRKFAKRSTSKHSKKNRNVLNADIVFALQDYDTANQSRSRRTETLREKLSKSPRNRSLKNKNLRLSSKPESGVNHNTVAKYALKITGSKIKSKKPTRYSSFRDNFNNKRKKFSKRITSRDRSKGLKRATSGHKYTLSALSGCKEIINSQNCSSRVNRPTLTRRYKSSLERGFSRNRSKEKSKSKLSKILKELPVESEPTIISFDKTLPSRICNKKEKFILPPKYENDPKYTLIIDLEGALINFLEDPEPTHSTQKDTCYLVRPGGIKLLKNNSAPSTKNPHHLGLKDLRRQHSPCHCPSPIDQAHPVPKVLTHQINPEHFHLCSLRQRPCLNSHCEDPVREFGRDGCQLSMTGCVG